MFNSYVSLPEGKIWKPGAPGDVMKSLKIPAFAVHKHRTTVVAPEELQNFSRSLCSLICLALHAGYLHYLHF